MKEILVSKVPQDITEAELHSYIKVESSSLGVIDIVVSGPDGVDINEVANTIYMYLKSKMEEVNKSVVDHVFTYIATTTYTKNVGIVETNDRGTLDHIQKAIIVFLIGLIFGIIIAGLYYIIRLPIQTPEQIQNRLDIRYLGGIQRAKRLSLADRIVGTLRMGNEEKAMGIIAANIEEFVGKKKRILVSGTVSDDIIERFIRQLSLKWSNGDFDFIGGSDINDYADTIKKLSNSDAVILVERINKSQLKKIRDEIIRIDMSSKEIIGYVLY